MKTISRLFVFLSVLIPSVSFSDTGFANSIRATEVDGSPACTVGILKVSNGTLQCQGQAAIITTGGSGGGGGSSSLQVTSSGTQISSPTASLNFYAGDFNTSLAGSATAQIYLNPATTDFINNVSALQSGSVFFVSSGTVSGQLNVKTGPLTIYGATGSLNFSKAGVGATDQSIDYASASNTFQQRILMTNANISTPGSRKQTGWNFQDLNQLSILSINKVTTNTGSLVVHSTGSIALYDGTDTNAVIVRSSDTNTTVNHVIVLPPSPATSTSSFVNVNNITGNVVQLQYFDLFGANNTFTGSETNTSGNGVSVTYGVAVGSMTASSATVAGQFTAGTYQGANLATCGDSTHGLSWSGGTFGCQSITGSGGGGGASSLAVATGSAAGYNGLPISSPTAVISFDQSQFSAKLLSATTAFISVAFSTISKTGSYTATSTDTVIVANCASACTVTLPTAAAISGKIYHVKMIGAGPVSIATTSSQTIDGATTITPNPNQWTNIEVISDGLSWSIL